jgi:hypothetical protein
MERLMTTPKPTVVNSSTVKTKEICGEISCGKPLFWWKTWSSTGGPLVCQNPKCRRYRQPQGMREIPVVKVEEAPVKPEEESKKKEGKKKGGKKK